MKNLLILFLSLFMFVVPAFAGNLLQQEYEANKMQEMSKEQTLYNMSKESLLKNDYQGYLNGGRSMYGYMLTAKAEAEKTKNVIDLKYANLMINQYNTRIKTINSNLFQLQKIHVDDNEYKQLTDLTKICLYFFNIMAY